ncbi:DUF1848 domain-containing protein [Eubacterium sp. 1001713B170207_170306_E7]|uniref:DUF1848 domain-containing protein n=1 Tax=Eubacterium sp. 1001713B170207_170306_E7 TaxID=2787097 RepID=UPI00189B8AD6|nr:DUF1848 domain-containing protein [Eubacterium sp. 1001713B170207_170306_E7]
MIISASRRTDIPAFFSEWFIRRLAERYVYVRNPFNPKVISSISLSPEVVDGIVFWTKNAVPMIPKLDQLGEIPFYFHWTINLYGRDIEPYIPSKNDVLIPGFKQLSNKIGNERIIWRYNPIVFTSKYTTEYHLYYFEKLSRMLSGCTKRCIVSFLDYYEDTRQNMRGLGLTDKTDTDKINLIRHFSSIAHKYHIDLEVCTDRQRPEGVKRACCVDKAIFERVRGYPLSLKKDPGQRSECRCMESIDIGMYDTCGNGCRYCYANHSRGRLLYHQKCHFPDSPLIIGKVEEDDIIKERTVSSDRENQLRFLIE